MATKKPNTGITDATKMELIALKSTNPYWQSSCIRDEPFAKAMRQSSLEVINGKKEIIIALLLVYFVFAITTAAKHCLRQSSDRAHKIMSIKYQMIQEDIIKRNYFFLLFIIISHQIVPTLPSIILSFMFTGVTLILFFLSVFIQDEVTLLKLRLGTFCVQILITILHTIINVLVDDWCYHFYYSSVFSQKIVM